jgi:hypothetical protein
VRQMRHRKRRECGGDGSSLTPRKASADSGNHADLGRVNNLYSHISL